MLSNFSLIPSSCKVFFFYYFFEKEKIVNKKVSPSAIIFVYSDKMCCLFYLVFFFAFIFNQDDGIINAFNYSFFGLTFNYSSMITLIHLF